MQATEIFKVAVINASDSSANSGSSAGAPVRYLNDESYFFIRHQDMYVVAVSKKNANAGTPAACVCVCVCVCMYVCMCV